MGAQCTKVDEGYDSFNDTPQQVPATRKKKRSHDDPNQNSLLRVGSRIFASKKRGGVRQASNYNHVHQAVLINLSENSDRQNQGVVPNGVVGLTNLGNTCFLNSSIQCLSNTIPLTDYFLGYDYKHEINYDNFLGTKGKLVNAYAELMKTMWVRSSSQRQSAIAPRKFRSKLSDFAPQFSNNYQHDAQEFLAYLLDGIHEDLNRVKSRPYIEDKDCDGTNDEQDAIQAWKNYLLRNKSLVVDLFQGQLKNTCACRECGFCNIRFEPFMYLSLPIGEKSKSLQDCLDLYLQKEDLVGDNQWYCTKCKKHVDATKILDLWVLPPILIIHLKRFRYSESGGRSKNGAALRYPIESWDLSKVKKSRGGEFPLYDLYAIANHHGGGLGSGHYTAHALNRLDEQWYEFNDSRFKKIHPETHIQNSESPYLLFYNRCDRSDSDRLNSSDRSAPGPLIRRQSLNRPDLWPHMQVQDAHFRDFSRTSNKSLIKGNKETNMLMGVGSIEEEEEGDEDSSSGHANKAVKEAKPTIAVLPPTRSTRRKQNGNGQAKPTVENGTKRSAENGAAKDPPEENGRTAVEDHDERSA